MEALSLHQALVDAGMPGPGTGAAARFLQNLCHRLAVSNAAAGLKQQFFDLLTHLLEKSPSLACSWLADFLAFSSALSSSDPEEAYILQPQSVLAWCQQTAAGLKQRVGAFLRSGPAAHVDAVLELQQAAQALLSVASAVQAVSSSNNSVEVQQLVDTLQQLQQATKVLQVLEQLQQQQLGSPARPQAGRLPNGTPAGGSSGAAGSTGGFGQQPLFRPRNAARDAWQQQLAQRRAAAQEGHLFLDDLLLQLKQEAHLRENSPALAYPYQDVLTCIDTLFVSSNSSSKGAWHAKLSVLLYYLLDGGWLSSAEHFAQGFQLPLTMVQQWQCHHLMDAAVGSSTGGKAGSSSSSKAAAGNTAALDKACQLLGAIACPSTPFRFVEALLQAGRPATALAVQRARCAGGTSSSGSSRSGSTSGLTEAEVLLRVQLGCGLLAEAFCDLRRHCSQVAVSDRAAHTNTLVRQLTSWALSPMPSSDAAAAAAAAASQMQQQLRLQEQRDAAVLAAAGLLDGGSSSDGSWARQQQLLQLPFNAAEESVVVAVLRERMSVGKTGGHLLPLYLLQRGRVLEALSAYADYKASTAAAGAGHQATDAAAEGQAAASRALLHKQLDAVMAAAAAALPPALRAAAAAAAAGGSSSDGSSGLRSVLQGLGGPEARRLQGDQGGSVLLQQRGVEPPCFLAPLLHATDAAVGGAAAAAAGAGSATPAAVGTALGKGPGLFTGIGARSGLSSGALGLGGGSTSRQQGAAATAAKDSVLQPLLFEDEVKAEAGPGTVKLGGKDTARQDPAADVVPLLFGTPAPAAAAAAAGKTPGVVRGGLFDTPAAGAAMWDKTPGTGAAGFGMMSEADFERQVRFGTPQPQAAEAGAPGAGVFLYTGQRSHKRMRKTPM